MIQWWNFWNLKSTNSGTNTDRRKNTVIHNNKKERRGKKQIQKLTKNVITVTFYTWVILLVLKWFSLWLFLFSLNNKIRCGISINRITTQRIQIHWLTDWLSHIRQYIRSNEIQYASELRTIAFARISIYWQRFYNNK